jgi:hypothetical protein
MLQCSISAQPRSASIHGAMLKGGGRRPAPATAAAWGPTTAAPGRSALQPSSEGVGREQVEADALLERSQTRHRRGARHADYWRRLRHRWRRSRLTCRWRSLGRRWSPTHHSGSRPPVPNMPTTGGGRGATGGGRG